MYSIYCKVRGWFRVSSLQLCIVLSYYITIVNACNMSLSHKSKTFKTADIFFIKSSYMSFKICHGPAGVPGLATRCLCVLSTWLVVCCWCHVLPCLMLCVYVDCTQLSACLFFPFGVVFVHLCFYFVIKKPD